MQTEASELADGREHTSLLCAFSLSMTGVETVKLSGELVIHTVLLSDHFFFFFEVRQML